MKAERSKLWTSVLTRSLGLLLQYDIHFVTFIGIMLDFLVILVICVVGGIHRLV